MAETEYIPLRPILIFNYFVVNQCCVWVNMADSFNLPLTHQFDSFIFNNLSTSILNNNFSNLTLQR